MIDLPQLPETAAAPSLSGGAQLSEFLTLEDGEELICLTTLDESSPGLALGTEQGVVKRVVPDYPAHKEELEVITLKDGDRIVGAAELRTGEEDLVFITNEAQLLRYPASQVRPQGLPAGGMTGIKLGEGAKVISFAAVDPATDAMVFTVAGLARHTGRFGGDGQAHAVRPVPAQGPGDRRCALPAIPQGRGLSDPGVGCAHSGTGR